jgi:hypothetical protein
LRWKNPPPQKSYYDFHLNGVNIHTVTSVIVWPRKLSAALHTLLMFAICERIITRVLNSLPRAHAPNLSQFAVSCSSILVQNSVATGSFELRSLCALCVFSNCNWCFCLCSFVHVISKKRRTAAWDSPRAARS